MPPPPRFEMVPVLTDVGMLKVEIGIAAVPIAKLVAATPLPITKLPPLKLIVPVDPLPVGPCVMLVLIVAVPALRLKMPVALPLADEPLLPRTNEPPPAELTIRLPPPIVNVPFAFPWAEPVL